MAGKEPASGDGEAPAVESTLPPVGAGDFIGDYRVDCLIGSGGMGWVFGGMQPTIERRVAIKVLKPALAADPAAVSRFLAEARAANRVGHPNIVDIYALTQLPGGAPCLVMDWYDGESLRHWLGGRTELPGPRVAAILEQVLDGLEAAHRAGIVHRDLKPDNVFLARRPDGSFHVKLLDFGVAKLLEDGATQGVTRSGVPVGTPAYMAPEQCLGRPVDHRADLYALGVLLYELFTGGPPFGGASYLEVLLAQVHQAPPPPQLDPSLPESLGRLIRWCLAKEPASRPKDVAAIRDQLAETLASLRESGAVRRPLRRSASALPPGRSEQRTPRGEEAADDADATGPTFASGDPVPETTAGASTGEIQRTAVETRAEDLGFASPALAEGRRRLWLAGLGALALAAAIFGASRLTLGEKDAPAKVGGAGAMGAPAGGAPAGGARAGASEARAEEPHRSGPVGGPSAREADPRTPVPHRAAPPSEWGDLPRDGERARPHPEPGCTWVRLESVPAGAKAHALGRELGKTPVRACLPPGPPPVKVTFRYPGRASASRLVDPRRPGPVRVVLPAPRVRRPVGPLHRPGRGTPAPRRDPLQGFKTTR